MKVALYARVSSPSQEKRGTIGSQIEALRTYAQERKHIIAEDYVCKDEGYSGALLARPALDRLRDGAQAGAFDAVLVLSPDRLSRKYAYLILILEEFERFGTEVIFLEQVPGDDPHSALLVQIQGAVAEYERAKLAERYRRGKLHRARQGEIFWASIPYGYRRVPRQDGVPAHWVIDEAAAEVVRKMFVWHLDEQMSMRQITKRLIREGYPTPRGATRWGETTVHRILTRQAYLGTHHYNTTAMISVPVSETHPTGKRQIERPKSEWIPVMLPAIIDRQTFARSQTRHKINEQFSPRNLHEEHWLLRRLLRCEKCGCKCHCVADKRRPHMPPAYYYRCDRQDRMRPKARCRPNHIRAKPLDELVWTQIRRHLLDPELLLKAQTAVSDTQCVDPSFLSTQVKNARRSCDKLEVQRRRLLDLFQEGFIRKEEFEERMRTVSTRMEDLREELTALDAEYKNASAGKDLLARIRDFTSTVTERLDKLTFHERQQLARTLLQEVVIHGNVVKLYFKIPLPKTQTNNPGPVGTLPGPRVSSQLSLRTRCGQHMQVGVKALRKITKGLCGNNSRGDRLGFRHRRLQEGLQTFPGAAAQLNQQLAIMQEETAEDLGDGEDEVPVRHGPEHMTAEPLAELHGPFLSTAWAEFPFFTSFR